MGSPSRSLGRFAVLTFTLLVVGCPPQPVEPTPGPAPEGRRPELCGQACKRWAALGCEEGGQVCDRYHEPDMVCEAWIACEAWCMQVETGGPQSLNLVCVTEAKAATCEALEDACAY